MVLAPSWGCFGLLQHHTSALTRTQPASTLPTASCGPPPRVRNASIFGKGRQRYETNAVVRYHCAQGFQQRLTPLIRCLSGGRWERPQVLCIPGKTNDYRNPDRLNYFWETYWDSDAVTVEFSSCTISLIGSYTVTVTLLIHIIWQDSGGIQIFHIKYQCVKR